MKSILPFILLLFLGAKPPVEIELPRSTPEAQGISSAAILAFLETADREIDTMNSIMILRHGNVVTEGWWTPYNPESPHILYSLTKSFTSTAVGLAIDEGKLSLHDDVISFFPDDVPEDPSFNLQAMRVHDLLRMATGHDDEAQMSGPGDWIKAFLEHPVPHLPGTHFQYNTPATHMLSAIVQEVTGETVEDYLEPRLFEPLEIENPIWLKSPRGYSIGGYGLSVRTEDIARFGQLYLQGGEWEGEQLVPANWVQAATSLQTSNGSNPDSDWNQGYGYQFWRSQHNAYRGDGAFGQYCLVIPEHDVVIAITSGVRNMQAVLDLIWEMLLPAFEADALPEDPVAHQLLQEKLQNLHVKPADGVPTSRSARKIARKPYAFSENEQGIQSIAFEFGRDGQAMVVQTDEGESRIPFGMGEWETSRAMFSNGMEQFVGVNEEGHAMAASAGWTGDNELTVKIVLYETPYYTTMKFGFDGDVVEVSGEYNVAFGPSAIETLNGTR